MISFEPLRVLKTVNNITLQDIIQEGGINSKVAVKFNRDESVTTKTLDKLIKYLSKKLNREVKVEEIMKYVSDENDQ